MRSSKIYMHALRIMILHQQRADEGKPLTTLTLRPAHCERWQITVSLSVGFEAAPTPKRQREEG